MRNLGLTGGRLLGGDTMRPRSSVVTSEARLELNAAESSEEKPLLPDGGALIGWGAGKLVRAPWPVSRGKRRLSRPPTPWHHDAMLPLSLL